MKVRSEIFLAFVGIMFVTILISSMVYYFYSKSNLKRLIFSNLEALAESKADHFHSIVIINNRVISLLQNREMIILPMARYNLNQNKNDLASLNNSMKIIQEDIAAFKNIILLNPKGEVITSAFPIEETNLRNQISFQHALEGEQCQHEFYYDSNNHLVIMLSGRIKYNDTIQGVIIAETFADNVERLLTDYTSLGQTGEVNIAIDGGKDHEAIYLTPIRHMPDVGLSLSLYDDQNYVSEQALKGEERIYTDLLDYRGEEVIASTRHIMPLGWALIAKIDKKEAYAPIYELQRKTAITTFILFVVTLILAYYYSRYFIKPVEKVTSFAKRVAAGELYSKVVIKRKNETQEMAEALNTMKEQLLLTQDQLKEKVEVLDKNNESLQKFAYTISHDLKSPLNTFASILAMAKKHTTKNQKLEGLMKLLDDRTIHMRGLIDAVLQYARTGNEHVPKEIVDLKQLIYDILQDNEVPEHISVNIINNALPLIYIEKVLIKQVFQNLISNAFKYIDKKKGIVEIGYTTENDFLCFFVKDNGPGIPEEHFQQIFELFNKIKTNPNVDSTGVGLSIVKKIIESKGGKVWVESELTKGSTFKFLLPKESVQV